MGTRTEPTLVPAMLSPDVGPESGWIAVLAVFVAINAVMYCALAIAKAMPRFYVADYVRRAGRRSESRSIHPDYREAGAYDGGHERRPPAPDRRGT